MHPLQPIILRMNAIRLEPLSLQHATGLQQAAADGELWNLVYTSVPEPLHTATYIETALHTANRLAFAVIDETHQQVIGSTSYHDINVPAQRLEIGYTWYGKSHWRSHVNTTCKYLLLQHAFETLMVQTVGWRTDQLNHRSQQAIERLGAKKDGVIRGFQTRRDGSVRDTVMYSMTQNEWAVAKAHLRARLGLPQTEG